MSKVVCPYFRDNRCGSPCLPELNLDISIIPVCETPAYNRCPVFIATIQSERSEQESKPSENKTK